MPTFGRIEAFEGEGDDWPAYVERVQEFFEANDVNAVDDADVLHVPHGADVFDMWHLSGEPTVPPFLCTVEMSGKPFPMELDTGASVSVMPMDKFQRVFPEVSLEPSNVFLGGFSGELEQVKGKANVRVGYKGHERVLPLYLTSGAAPTLLGRNWFQALGIGVEGFKEINQVSDVRELIARFPEVFAEGIGTFKGVAAKILVPPNAVPKFCKPRPLPFVLVDRVTQEILRVRVTAPPELSRLQTQARAVTEQNWSQSIKRQLVPDIQHQALRAAQRRAKRQALSKVQPELWTVFRRVDAVCRRRNHGWVSVCISIDSSRDGTRAWRLLKYLLMVPRTFNQVLSLAVHLSIQAADLAEQLVDQFAAGDVAQLPAAPPPAALPCPASCHHPKWVAAQESRYCSRLAYAKYSNKHHAFEPPGDDDFSILAELQAYCYSEDGTTEGYYPPSSMPSQVIGLIKSI
ncbi:hypothetical protein MTO96_028413 [Rhipicephalus appendiculatus]